MTSFDYQKTSIHGLSSIKFDWLWLTLLGIANPVGLSIWPNSRFFKIRANGMEISWEVFKQNQRFVKFWNIPTIEQKIPLRKFLKIWVLHCKVILLSKISAIRCSIRQGICLDIQTRIFGGMERTPRPLNSVLARDPPCMQANNLSIQWINASTVDRIGRATSSIWLVLQYRTKLLHSEPKEMSLSREKCRTTVVATLWPKYLSSTAPSVYSTFNEAY